MKTYRFVNYAVIPVHSINKFKAIIYFAGSDGSLPSDPFDTEDEASEYIINEIDAHWERKGIFSQPEEGL